MLSRRSQFTSFWCRCPFSMETGKHMSKTQNMGISKLKLKLRMRWVQPCYLKGPNSYQFSTGFHFPWKLATNCQKPSKLDILKLKLKLRMRWVQLCYLESPKSHHFDTGVHFLWKLTNKCQKTPKIVIFTLKLKLRMRDEYSTPMIRKRSQFTSFWCRCPFFVKTGKHMSNKHPNGNS